MAGEDFCKLGKEYLSAPLCKFCTFSIQHSETFWHITCPSTLTVARLPTLKVVRFWPILHAGTLMLANFRVVDSIESSRQVVILCLQKRPDPVKAKVLELIQVWSHAFRNESSYKVVQETYNDMKREGLCLSALYHYKCIFFLKLWKWFCHQSHLLCHSWF